MFIGSDFLALNTKLIMSKTYLDRSLFAALHQKIVETCYPDEEYRATIWTRTETAFYGIDFPPESDSICDKMQKSLGMSINGRAFYNLKNLYNQQLKEIPVSDKHLKNYLTFIEHSQSDLKGLAQAYKASLPGFPPKTIRQDQVHKSATGNHLKLVEAVGGRVNLNNLCNGPWWFYFYEYTAKNSNRFIRLVLTFKKVGDSRYSVLLKNSGAPYTDFSGWVTQATDDNIVCALTGRKKQMTIMFTVEETGSMDIYPGIYLKHDSRHQLYSGSVLIHRIPATSVPPLEPQVFEQGSTELDHIPKSIAAFFLEKKYVYIKTPRQFNDDKLSQWLQKKKVSRNEIKDIDLFVSATIVSAKEKRASLRKIKETIGAAVLDFIKKRNSSEVNPEAVEALLEQIDEAQKLDLAHQFPTDGAFSTYSSFHQEVQDIIKKLASEIEELTEDRISYSFQELPPGGFLHQEPKFVLKRDFEQLKRSKGLLVISPYNRVFSSCWVLAGRAITMGIPTFLIYRNEENLPYILRQANIYEHVHLLRLRQNDLQAIPFWFKHSDFGPKYFR